jgi:hypothetical protein
MTTINYTHEMNAFTSNRWRRCTTTLIRLDPWLLHHFIVSTNMGTPDQESIYLDSLQLEF